jgi:chemotaxis protein CheX
MDVNYINPFLNGTLEVLKKMAFLDAVAGKPYVKKTDVAVGDVSAIIGITGDAIGSLAISFSEPCICHIVNNMLGEAFTEANNDVFDAAGEITNMVSGVARSYLEKDGLTVFAAIPTVVYGKGHTIQHILKAPSIIVPFSTNKGNFTIDVCIKRIEESAKKDQVYRVLNVSTADMRKQPAKPSQAIPTYARPTAKPPVPSAVRPPAPPAAQSPAPPTEMKKQFSIKDAKNEEEKKQILKEKLAELTAKRSAIQKELLEKPFMPYDQRKKLNKEVPLYDEKIRRLKLDISAMEMISKMTQEQFDNPKPKAHFQDRQSK